MVIEWRSARSREGKMQGSAMARLVSPVIVLQGDGIRRVVAQAQQAICVPLLSAHDLNSDWVDDRRAPGEDHAGKVIDKLY